MIGLESVGILRVDEALIEILLGDIIGGMLWRVYLVCLLKNRGSLQGSARPTER